MKPKFYKKEGFGEDMKRVLIGIFFVSLCLMNFVSAEMNLSDSLSYQRYQNILNEFDKGNEWVSVSITLISSESKALLVNSLSEEEFILSEGPSTKTSVFGKVTKEGLEKLVGSQYIKDINLDESISPTNQEEVKQKSKIPYIVLVVIIFVLGLVIFIIRKRNKQK